MLPLVLVVAGALATARLTRLAVADRLTLPLRHRVLRRLPEGGSLEYLLSCAWCVSVWVGALVAAFITPVAFAGEPPTTRVLGWLLLALAYSQVTGRLAGSEVEA